MRTVFVTTPRDSAVVRRYCPAMLRTACMLACVVGGLAVVGPALADPCTRIPDRGQMPPEARRGQTFSGPVVYVGDGDSLCVRVVPNIGGAGWLEVRLADFNSPELNEPGGHQARDTLRRIAMNRTVHCAARNRTWDRVAADCRLNGSPLGRLMRDAGIREGGR